MEINEKSTIPNVENKKLATSENQKSFLSKIKSFFAGIVFIILTFLIVWLTFAFIEFLLMQASNLNSYLFIAILLIGMLNFFSNTITLPVATLFAKAFSLLSVKNKFANLVIVAIVFMEAGGFIYSIWGSFYSHEFLENGTNMAIIKSIALTIFILRFAYALYQNTSIMMEIENLKSEEEPKSKLS